MKRGGKTKKILLYENYFCNFYLETSENEETTSDVSTDWVMSGL